MTDAKRWFGPMITVVVAAVVLMAVLLAPAPVAQSKDTELMAFTSQAHMDAYLKRTVGQSGQQGQSTNVLGDMVSETATGSSAKGNYHSTTNVQVAGVQEADTVITDGEYAYLVSWDNILVVRIYPAEQMANVSSIDAASVFGQGTNLTLGFSGMYLYGNKLVAIASVQEQMNYPWGVYKDMMMPFYYYSPATIAAVFDMTDPSHPALEMVEGISGSCTTSRMVGPVLHMVTEMGIWWQENVEGPYFWSVSGKTALPASKVFFDPSAENPTSFQVLFSLNVSDGAKDAMALLGTHSSVIYMTETTLYLACPKYTWTEAGSTCITSVHRITISGTSTALSGKATIDGWLLNQFSMDEKDGKLRLATTSGGRNPVNSVYVLSADMNVEGELAGIAAGETIQSARFFGDTLYLVTFLRMDPLFVIDLSTPSAPRVMGELVIPGFSSYLHPLGGGMLVGVGNENGTMKIDLYDVSDPAHPAVIRSIMMPSYSYSEAQWDQKAFMFDAQRQMFAVPIHVYGFYPEWTYASSVHLFQVKNGTMSLVQKYAGPPTESISRAMFVEDVLYTVSETSIMAWDMLNGRKLNSMVYQDQMNWYMMCYAVGGVVGDEEATSPGVSEGSSGSAGANPGTAVDPSPYTEDGEVHSPMPQIPLIIASTPSLCMEPA